MGIVCGARSRFACGPLLLLLLLLLLSVEITLLVMGCVTSDGGAQGICAGNEARLRVKGCYICGHMPAKTDTERKKPPPLSPLLVVIDMGQGMGKDVIKCWG
jgi:hypothetical protein